MTKPKGLLSSNMVSCVLVILMLGGSVVSCVSAASRSDLTAEQKNLVQQVVGILSTDPEYNRLGYTDEQFQYLATTSDCFPLAVIRSDPGKNEKTGEALMMARPHLELVIEIHDLEGYRGNLLQELADDEVLQRDLSGLSRHVAKFLNVIIKPGLGWLWSIINAFTSVKEHFLNPLSNEYTTHAFNELYSGYREYREKGLDAGSAFDSVNTEKGPYWQDQKTIGAFYADLNTKANLGWDETQITSLIQSYLESRYKTEKGIALKSWEVPVTKPEHAMENLFRDALHEVKLLHIKDLRAFTEPCVREMPTAGNPLAKGRISFSFDKLTCENEEDVLYSEFQTDTCIPGEEANETELLELSDSGLLAGICDASHTTEYSAVKLTGRLSGTMVNGRIQFTGESKLIEDFPSGRVEESFVYEGTGTYEINSALENPYPENMKGTLTYTETSSAGTKKCSLPWTMGWAITYLRGTGTGQSGTGLGKAGTGVTEQPTQPQELPRMGCSGTETSLYTDNRAMNSGQDVTIPIIMCNARDVANMDLSAEYIPSVLTFKKAVKGSLNANTIFESNNVGNTVKIAFAGKTGFSGTGSIAILTFTVIGKDGSSSPITIHVNEAVTGSGTPVDVSEQNGQVTVGNTNPNNPGGNPTGKPTSLDALMALQMSVGKLTVDLNYDLTKDGKVSSGDAREILRIVVQ